MLESLGVAGKVFSDTVRDKCELTCRDFLHDELPDLAFQHLTRYMASLIEGGLPEDVREMRESYRVLEEGGTSCVKVRVGDEDRVHIVMGLNLSRNEAEEALAVLKASQSKERYFLYLFSCQSISDEATITNAIMEPELLRMVRDTGIVVYFAMLDARAGMGMMARIDGDLRSIQYLPH